MEVSFESVQPKHFRLGQTLLLKKKKKTHLKNFFFVESLKKYTPQK